MGKILKDTKIAKQIRHRVKFHREWNRILVKDAITSEINSQSNIDSTNAAQQPQQTQTDEIVVKQTTEEKLRCWVFKHNITRSAISDLLKILISIGMTWLPKDSRTFLSTPRNVEISTLSIGHLW